MPRTQSFVASVAAPAAPCSPCRAPLCASQFSKQPGGLQCRQHDHLQATFNAAAESYYTGTYTEGLVSFVDLVHRLYIAGPGGRVVAAGYFAVPLTSKVLVSDDYENIRMTFSGAAPTAVGFTSITNNDTIKPTDGL